MIPPNNWHKKWLLRVIGHHTVYRTVLHGAKHEALKSDWWTETKQRYQGYINDAGIEYYLQKLLYDAAADDHILQPNELKSYVKDNPIEWRPFANMLNRLTGGSI